MMGGRSLLNTCVFLLSFRCLLAAKSRLGDEHAEEFHAFMRKHGRSYPLGSHEYRQRSALFALRRYEAELHNSDPNRMWTAGINALSDRTEQELAQLRGWRGGAMPKGASGLLQKGGTASHLSRRAKRRNPLPTEWKWDSLTNVKNIRDQGGCGSCWAVTSATVLAQHYEIANPGHQRTFSAQELVSCSPNRLQCGGNGGCGGSTVELAYDWVRRNGVAEESEAPYQASDVKLERCNVGALMQMQGHGHGHGHGHGNGDGVSNETSDQEILELFTAGKVQDAPDDSPSRAFGMVGFMRLGENKYEDLLRSVVERGPVAVSMAASGFSSYRSGIFDCVNSWVVDHAVALIGFGKDPKTSMLFYKIQNSWGDSWGEKGTMRVIRHEDDGSRCGDDNQPELGTGCKGGPAVVRVCGPCGILYDSVTPLWSSSAISPSEGQ